MASRAFQPTTWLVLLIALMVSAALSGTVADAARISGTPPDRVPARVRGHARPAGSCGVDEVALGDTDYEATAEILPTAVEVASGVTHATAVEVASGVAHTGPNAAAPKEILNNRHPSPSALGYRHSRACPTPYT